MEALSESGPIDDFGLVEEDGVDEGRNLLRGVFEIGILNDDGFAGCGGEALSDRSPFSAGFWVCEDSDFVAEFCEDGASLVGRAIVDNNDLGAERKSKEAVDDLADCGLFVEGRDDDGDLALGSNVSVHRGLEGYLSRLS